MAQIELQRQDRLAHPHRLIDADAVTAADPLDQAVRDKAAKAAQRLYPHMSIRKTREPPRAQRRTAVGGIGPGEFEQRRPKGAADRDFTIIAADVFDHQAMAIGGKRGTRVQPAFDADGSAPPPAERPALPPQIDQVGIFLGNARPIPGLTRRDAVHPHL